MHVERLALSVDPIAGESLPGYVARLARRALIPTADRVAVMAGLRQPGSAFHAPDLARLAMLAGADQGTLDRMAYQPLARASHHRFLGGTLHREFIDVSRRRACPGCLRTSGHHRSAWDLALTTACTEHRVRLIVACPACRRKLVWGVPDLTRCRCRSSLADYPGEQVSAEEAASQAAMSALASGGPLPSMPECLIGCERADLVRLVMCLGMFLIGWRKERRVETLVAAGPDAVAGVVSAGLGCLDDWPGGLHGFFSAEHERARLRPGRYGARKTLGPFYDWLSLMEAGPIRTALAEAASSFVHADEILARQAHRSTLVAAPAGSEARAMGMLDAGARLGMRSAGVRRLLNAGLLNGVASAGRGIPAALDARDVEGLARTMTNALDLAGTARLLGISKDRVRRLVDGGLLSPSHRGNAAGWRQWSFDGAEVASLLLRVEGTLDALSGEKTMSFETAVEVFRRRGVGIADVLGKVLVGRLVIAGLDTEQQGLKRFRFSTGDVRRVSRLHEDHEVPLTVQAAATQLGLKWQVVAHLVRAGLLGDPELGIVAADVASFQARYVSGAELARQERTSPRHVAGLLAARGVRPVVGPGMDGSRQNFYLREQAERCPPNPRTL